VSFHTLVKKSLKLPSLIEASRVLRDKKLGIIGWFKGKNNFNKAWNIPKIINLRQQN